MLWLRWNRSVAWLWAAVWSTVLYYELAMKVPIPVGITVYIYLLSDFFSKGSRYADPKETSWPDPRDTFCTHCCGWGQLYRRNVHRSVTLFGRRTTRTVVEMSPSCYIYICLAIQHTLARYVGSLYLTSLTRVGNIYPTLIHSFQPYI